MECRPNGQEELSAKVSFAISEAISEGATKEKEDKVFWIPQLTDATDYVNEDEEQKMAEEEYRRAETVEEVAVVGRKNTNLKVRVVV